MAEDSNSDLDDLGKGLGNANFLNGLDSLSKMQPKSSSDSDSDSDKTVDPLKLVKEHEKDSFNPSEAMAEQMVSDDTSSGSSSPSASSSNTDDNNQSDNDNSDTSEQSHDLHNTTDSGANESASQTPSQIRASKEANNIMASKSEAESELKNNDVTSDKNQDSTASLAQSAENQAQKNLDAHKLPPEAMQDFDSPDVQLNKARGAHNSFIQLMKDIHKNGGKISDKDFSKMLDYSTTTFNNLYQCLVKSRKQRDFRLQQIEGNLQHAKDEANKGTVVINKWKEEGLFANISKNMTTLDRVVNDPRFQSFVRSNRLANTKLEQPTLLAKKGEKAQMSLKKMDDSKPKK